MFKSRTHYINHFRRLINLERDADIKRHEDEIKNMSGSKREKKGRALLNMRGKRAGSLYGNQYIVKYMKMDMGSPLPELDMNVGDVVVVSQGQPLKKGNPLGTIVEKGRHAITVLYDGYPDKWMLKNNLRVDLYVNDVTYRRMQEALDVVMYGRETSPRLLSWIIGEKDKYIPNKEHEASYNTDNFEPRKPFNTTLNVSQKRAVREAMQANDFYIVHGPPGTGKTITGVEILCQCKGQYERILATADSNGAVDNIALGLLKYDLNVVRIGRPFKVHDDLKTMTLDAQLQSHTEYKQVERLREKAFAKMKEQEGLKHPSPRWTRGLRHNEIHKLAKKGKGSRGVSSSDMKSMSKWLQIREEVDTFFNKADALEIELTQKLLKEADVILATNSGSGQALLEGWEFDLVLIDEATQSTESSALIPAVKGKRLILLGDHKQLPPTVISLEASEAGFSVSMLERLVERYGNQVVTMLDTQYRMHEEIAQFSNDQFYGGGLHSGERNRTWKLEGFKDEDQIEKTWLRAVMNIPSCFIQIKGQEKYRGEGLSLINSAEAGVVCEVVETLLLWGIEASQIGVISPYKAQTKLIREMMMADSSLVQVDTVDGFQGQEKDVIIISLVRANASGHLGFLTDVRRLNVALTRAKKLRVVIGDKNTISSHKMYKAFLDQSKIVDWNKS